MSKSRLISGLAGLAVAALVVAILVQPGPVDRSVGTKPVPARSGAESGDRINELVNAASPGDRVFVPGDRIYRETVVVDKPVTLIAGDGAEIRGSDVWRDWRRDGDIWRSVQAYPRMRVESRWRCEEGTGERCKEPEQVFVDGEPLERVFSSPARGEFALDRDRRVLLGESPAGSTVEVTVRDRWMVGEADDVTIRGFAMRHSAGYGIKNDRHDRWRVIGNDLSYAHTVNVELSKGPGMVIENNDIHHAGQMGVASNAARLTLRDNRIHDNNTAGFKTGWEAGGMKISATVEALVEDNEVFDNSDIGIWTDIATTGPQRITIRDNRVHDHPRQGIRVEISKNVEVSGNVVYGNGFGYPPEDLSGAGITLSGTRDALVADNLVAYNNNGLVVVNEDREKGFDTVRNVVLASNAVIQERGIAAAWMKAYPGGDIYDPSSANGGRDNSYYYPSPPDGSDRYKWESYYESLAGYNDTPGESGDELPEESKDALLRSRGLTSLR